MPMLLFKCLVVAAASIVVSGCKAPLLAGSEPGPKSLSEISQDPPSRCLAVSGGGIRAGAVALGVVQELHSQGQLEHFEHVSTVSGGGYPVAGLLWELQDEDATVDHLLGPQSEYIARVEENSSFIGNPFDELVVSAVFVWLYTPLRWLESLVSRRAILLNSPSVTYAQSIRTTFAPFFASTLGRNPALQGIRTDVLPSPIFVTASSPGQTAPKVGHTYEPGDLFELSPGWIGSEATGYWQEYANDLGLDDAIVASGAAVDTPSHEHGVILPDWARLLGFSLGRPIALPGIGWTFLSDGGFIENLAVLPLVRRGCREILAVDATSDPDLKFESLRNLLDHIDANEWAAPSAESIVDGLSRSDGWHLPQHEFSFVVESRRTAHSIDVTIVKLGIDLSNVAGYPGVVRDFIRQQRPEERQGCTGVGRGRRCAFPLETTFRQGFEPAEFKAYRELGRYLAGSGQRRSDLSKVVSPVLAERSTD